MENDILSPLVAATKDLRAALMRPALEATDALIASLERGADAAAPLEKWRHVTADSQKRANAALTRALRHVDSKVYQFDAVSEARAFGARVPRGARAHRLMNEVILAHVARSGHTDVTLALERACGVRTLRATAAHVEKLENIVCALTAQTTPDVGPALDWCAEHERELRRLNLDVDFDLRVLQFHLLSDGQATPEMPTDQSFAAYLYAKSELAPQLLGPGKERKLRSVARLLRSAVTNVDGAALATHVRQADVVRSFVKAFCTVHGLPERSNAHHVLCAAHAAMPQLVKFNHVHRRLRRLFLALDVSGARDALPVDISVPWTLGHPVFICPISKEETTATNPPVLLPCGHIILRDSMRKLAESRTYGRLTIERAPVDPVDLEDEDLEEGDFSEAEDDSLGEEAEEEESGTGNNQSRQESRIGGGNLGHPLSTFLQDTMTMEPHRISVSLSEPSFKCPYCPRVCQKGQTREVFFTE